MSCTIRASVTTGLEFLASEEVKEKLGAKDVEEGRGYVLWQNDIATVKQTLELRIIDHLEVVMSKFDIEFAADTDESLQQMVDKLPDVDWNTGIKVWSIFSPFEHTVSPLTIEQLREGHTDSDIEVSLPRYRATCYRTGQNHKFTSQQASHKLGGKIQDRFGWPVNLTQYDIEVVISIVDSAVTFGIGLTKQSLYHRNIEQFARTTLKSNISAAMIRLVSIKSGDIVVDPMCGSGSITLEGAIAHPDAFHLAGDVQEYCVQCSMNNIISLNEQRMAQNMSRLNAGAIQWDATSLPVQTGSIDVIITDLPFGKRHGNKIDNRKLYPSFLTEAARVTQPSTGRAVILTSDRNLMRRILPKVHEWWVVPRTSVILHGGLRAVLYLLKRTAKPW